MSDLLSYGYYDSVSKCLANSSLAMCTYITNDITLTYTNSFKYMRVKQDSVSLRMERELTTLATEDKNTQYMLIGICIGLVVLSAIIVAPIFLKVIRDKSAAFGIFAFIEQREIQQIIKECKKLDVKKARFKKEWLVTFAEQFNAFWRKVRNNNRDERSKPNKGSLPEGNKEQVNQVTPVELLQSNPDLKREEVKRSEESDIAAKEEEKPVADPNLDKRVQILGATEYL